MLYCNLDGLQYKVPINFLYNSSEKEQPVQHQPTHLRIFTATSGKKTPHKLFNLGHTVVKNEERFAKIVFDEANKIHYTLKGTKSFYMDITVQFELEGNCFKKPCYMPLF